MTATLAQIWRHPIKSHGAEALDEVTLREGECLPWDRTWAIAHEAAKADGSTWSHCANFSRGAKAPALMAVSAAFDPKAETITLSHPDQPPLTVRPDDDPEALVAWSRPLIPEGRATSARVVRVAGRGMTDTPFPSISVLSLTSLKILSQKLGQTLDPRRFRGNFWIEGLDPWEEFEWIGRTLRIGEAEMKVAERITRCLATAANPETGHRDADTLGALEEGWDHRDFGVYAEVTQGGTVHVGDPVTVS